MAQLLAPYNNGMRLGQGFNSYTQQICLDHAVLEDTAANRAKYKADLAKASRSGNNELRSGSDASDEVKTPDTESERDKQDGETRNVSGSRDSDSLAPPWVKSQIVTYSSKFVDKLSEVTDSMNISGSLSIKTGTIGGQASGSYINSDKFKESDLNFHLQVKVTNQVRKPANYTIFNKIDAVAEKDFVPVYGDCFISGWEEGGELNAIISVKVLDKSKIFHIKAELEASLSVPRVEGKIKASADIEDSNINTDTQTTVSVNWSGGGSIKAPEEDWTMASMKKVAAAFPDLVAITPQRTFAILTKYTALESFHRLKGTFSVLDYENASIYTSALLDNFMDYKLMWKQVKMAAWEIENRRATIGWAQPDDEVYEAATVKSLPRDQIAKTLAKVQQATPSNDSAADSSYTAFRPTIAGLIQAVKVCRTEMAKIVNEVDLVTKNPSYASDVGRDEYFLHPLIYRQLLPIVRSVPDSTLPGVDQTSGPVILGFDPAILYPDTRPPVVDWQSVKVPYEGLLRTSQECRQKAPNYLMRGIVGQVENVVSGSNVVVFNDLKQIDASSRPQEFKFWSFDEYIRGIEIRYANGQILSHGVTQGQATHTLALQAHGGEIVSDVLIRIKPIKGPSPTGPRYVIGSVGLLTTQYRRVDTARDAAHPDAKAPKQANDDTTKQKPAPQEAEKTTPQETQKTAPQESGPQDDLKFEFDPETEYTFTHPDDHIWSFRGFFGVIISGNIVGLGPIWGHDSFVPVPPRKPIATLSRDCLWKLGDDVVENLSRNFIRQPELAGNFLLGAFRKVRGGTLFNTMDSIERSWKLRTVGFSARGAVLTGLKLTYTNGQVRQLANYDVANEVWSFDIVNDLIIGKITGGREGIQTVEFIRSEKDGSQTTWPLNVSTSRFIGDSVVADSSPMIEAAPKLNNRAWTIRGFYGWHSGGSVVGLGLVWGCGN